jgi:aminoglycoside adenylyltransferase-like protein/nucleotidyltransferase-like protein
MTEVAERTALDAARDVVSALAEVEAAYAIGSAATGGFEAGASDLDVVLVLRGQPSRAELAELAERARAVDVAPARGLELVAYAGGEVVLNVNTGPGMTEHVGYAGDDPDFWFVLDRAIAREHARTLVGPPWTELFPPISRAEILAALQASLDWHAAEEPASRNTVLNTVRTWRWLETGEWVSKPAAAGWLLQRVRERVEEER